MGKRLSRRDFLKLTGTTSAGLALSQYWLRVLEVPKATSQKALSVYFQPSDEIFQQFDNYEISPCALLGKDSSGKLMYESCDATEENIAIWSVYGHFRTGGVECISDHNTYDEAKDFMETLPKMPLVPLLPV